MEINQKTHYVCSAELNRSWVQHNCAITLAGGELAAYDAILSFLCLNDKVTVNTNVEYVMAVIIKHTTTLQHGLEHHISSDRGRGLYLFKQLKVPNFYQGQDFISNSHHHSIFFVMHLFNASKLNLKWCINT